MNEQNYELAKGLVPSRYIEQGKQARHAHENIIRNLLSQVVIPLNKMLLSLF